MQLTGCSKGQGASCILISWSPLDNTHIVHSTLGQYTRPFVNCPDKPKSSQLSAQMWPLLSADLYCSPFDQLISNGRCFPLNPPTSIHTCTHKCAHSLLETLHSSMVLKTVTQPVSTRMQISAEICLLFLSPDLYYSFLINISLLATVFPLNTHQWTVTPQVSTSKHKEETVCSQCDLFFIHQCFSF